MCKLSVSSVLVSFCVYKLYKTKVLVFLCHRAEINKYNIKYKIRRLYRFNL